MENASKSPISIAELQRLCELLDSVEHSLRVYDAAFRFFKVNNPSQAALLDNAKVLAEMMPEIQNAASSEHGALHQEAIALVSRMLQEKASQDSGAQPAKQIDPPKELL